MTASGDGLKETLLDDTAQPASPRVDESALPSGTLVGRYTILERVGAGGMGVVYAANDPELHRKVAIKLLRAESARPDAKGRARLLREAQAIARLPHPNVVAVYDVGTFAEQVFVAMEFVEGKTLGAWVKQEHRGHQEVLEVYLQAGRALAAAHALGVIHRDFKPDNALIDDSGRVRVLDFGLARSSGAASPSAPQAQPAPQPLSDRLTRSGAVLGTPSYMAPEQHEGRPTDERTDQFSFCVALYEALYGERPFGGATMADLAAAIRAGRVREAPRDARVPAKVRQALLRGLQYDSDRRFGSMDELLGVLGDVSAWTRRKLAVAVVAIVALAAVGIGLQRRSTARMCQGATGKLAGAWDDAARARMRSALVATGRPYAKSVADRVQQSLDRYAAAWAGMHTDACEATHKRGEQSAELLDLRMECLARRRDALSALGDLLGHADAALLDNAVQATARLPAIDDCANATLLRASMRPALDPTVRTRLEPLRQAVARTRAVEAAGRYKDAIGEAQRLVGEAKALGYRPAEAETLYLLGSLQHQLGDAKAAEASLREAVLAADASHHDEVAARAATLLVRIVGFDQAHPADGWQWSRRAHAALEALGGNDGIEATLIGNEGALLFDETKFDDALEHYRRAVALRERVSGPHSVAVAQMLGDIAMVESARGDYELAVEHHRRSVAIQEEILGPDHPRLTSSLNNLGNSLAHAGHYGEALTVHRRVAALNEAARGEGLALGEGLTSVAADLYVLRRYEEALPIQRRAVAIFEKVHGPVHPDVAVALTNVGDILKGLERWGEATAALERARDIFAQTSGLDSMDAAETLIDLAELERARGRCADAVALYSKVRSEIEPQMGADHPALETIFVGLAECRAASGDGRGAVDLAEKAIAIDQKRKLPRDRLGESELTLARALWAAGRRDEARRTALQARADLATHPSPQAPREAEAWIAKHP